MALLPRSFAAGVVAGLALSWLRRALDWRQLLAGLLRPRLTAGSFKMVEKLSRVARAKRPAPLRSLIPLAKVEGGRLSELALLPLPLFPLALSSFIAVPCTALANYFSGQDLAESGTTSW